VDRLASDASLPVGECLAQTIGGNETEPARSTGTDGFGSAIPSVHHVIGTFRDLGVSCTNRFGVAVTEFPAHHPVADEGRVADDVVGLRPRRPARVNVFINDAARRFVGDFLPGNRISAHRALVPLRFDVAVFVACRLFAAIGEESVTSFDVVEAFDDGFGRNGRCAPGPEVPLQITDIEDKVSDDSSAGI